MKVHLGIKTDPIENRYSYDWLFRIMEEHRIPRLQLGSFFEIPYLDDGYFIELREKAQKRGIRITSVFSSHRDLSGFFSGDRHLEKAARRIFERFIHVGSLMGADYVGSSAGSVPRDMIGEKEAGVLCFFSHMEDLTRLALDKGLKALTIEVMSSSAEPPTFPEEIDRFMDHFSGQHEKHKTSTVPVYLLGDISHGYADSAGTVRHGNYELFEHSIPYMCEFHFKNTDSLFNATFGFSAEECKRGVVDLARLKGIIEKNASRWPVRETTGYLELPGPKLGRDYTDCKLEGMLIDSIEALKRYF